MAYRKLGQNPPYSYLIYVTVSHSNNDTAQNEAFILFEKLKVQNVEVLGPSDLGKVKDTYRYRLIIKGKDLDLLRSSVSLVIYDKTLKSEINADVNPMAVL